MADFRDSVVISGWAKTLMENCFWECPAELVALAVNLKVPAFEGVPEMMPSVESESPSGSLPEDMLHVMGVEPVASRVCV